MKHADTDDARELAETTHDGTFCSPAKGRRRKLELVRGKRGPHPRARFTAEQSAVARFVLHSEPDGIAHFAGTLRASPAHAAKVIAGTKAPPVGYDFEAVTQAVEPACTPEHTSIDLRTISTHDPLRLWMLRDRFETYVSPRSETGAPTATVCIDRVVLVACRDVGSTDALRERYPSIIDARSRVERLSLPDGRSATIRIEKAGHSTSFAKRHLRYDHALRFKMFTGRGWKLVASLRFDPRSMNLPPVRFEVTGEGSSLGLALPLARTYFLPFVIPGTVLLQHVEVAFDLDVPADRLLVLHDPEMSARALTTVRGEDQGGPIILRVGSSGLSVVVYDKLAELSAHLRSVPPHARTTKHLTRIEARFRKRVRGFDGSPESLLATARAVLPEMRVADLAYQPRLGVTAWMFDLVRRHGIVARPVSLKRKGTWVPSPRSHGLQGTVFEDLRRRGLSEQRAYAESVLVHAWTLQRVRELAERTPSSLAEMFDLAVPITLEPLLRALVDAPHGRYEGLARVPSEVA
jgi:hypothetical protein